MSDVSALLIIDMQNGLLHGPQPPLQKTALLANVVTLIHAARSTQTAIYLAQHTGPEGSPIAAGSPLWQLAPELPLSERDYCFSKSRPNCFFTTSLLQALRQDKVTRLVIAGMKTEYCVDTTCRAAVDLGFNVVLVSDAHSTTDSAILSAEQIVAHHNATLAGPFVTLVTTDEVRF